MLYVILGKDDVQHFAVRHSDQKITYCKQMYVKIGKNSSKPEAIFEIPLMKVL